MGKKPAAEVERENKMLKKEMDDIKSDPASSGVMFLVFKEKNEGRKYCLPLDQVVIKVEEDRFSVRVLNDPHRGRDFSVKRSKGEINIVPHWDIEDAIL